MSTQVGEGYIEIEPRFNRQMFNRMSGNIGRESSSAFSRGFERGTRNLTSNLENDLRRRMPSAFARGFSGIDREVDHVNRRVTRRIDRDSDHWGNTVGHHLLNGVMGFMSLMPARLESIFTKTGPIIGTALMAGLASALAIGLPALGAMVSGLLFAGVGIGAALAAGIVAAVNDPRVNAAATRLKNKFLDKVVNDKSIQFLGQVLANNLDKVTKALDRWAPHIQHILQAGAKFLGPIFDTFIAAMDIFLPVMDKLSNSKFVADLMKIFNSGILKIFEAFSVSFERFLNDPQAMEGAKQGLQDFFDLLAGGIKTIFDFLRALSRMWAALNQDSGPGKQDSPLDKMRHGWEDFRNVINSVVGAVVAAWNWVGRLISSAGGLGQLGTQIASTFKTVVSSIAVIASQVGLFFERLWTTIGPRVISTLSAIFRNIVGIISGGLQVIQGIFQVFQGIFTGKWSLVWQGIRNIIAGQFRAIVNVVKLALNAIWAIIQPVLGVIIIAWQSAFHKLSVHIQAWYHNVLAFTIGWWTNIKNWWNNGLRTIMGLWHNAWTAVRNFFVGIANGIANFFATWINRIAAYLYGKLVSILNAWRSVWNAVVNAAKTVWNTIWATITGYANRIATWLYNKLVGIQKAWNDIWNGMLRFLSGIWNSIGSAIQRGINGVIGIINKGIGLINKALKALGVSFQIPAIGSVGGGGISVNVKAPTTGTRGGLQRASGGPVYGSGSTTSDSIPVNLSRGEYVIRADSARSLGYQHLDMLNRYGARGYASGGRVGAGNNALLEHHRNHVHVAMGGPRMSWPQIVAAAKKSGIPFQVGSTYRPGSRAEGGGLDHHSEGRAVDFPGFNQDALASYFEHLAGVIELIHRSNKRDYAIFGGQGGGGMLGGIFQFLGKGWNWVLDHILRPAGNKATDGLFGKTPGNGLLALGKGWTKTIFNKVVDKAKAEFDQAKKMMDSGAASAGVGGGSQQWAGVAAAALNMLGLPQNWLGPLLTLIQRESGGNPRAINLTDSNAAKGTPSIGLMQTIGPTFNAYKLPGFGNIYSPMDNILAGLRYIKARYGSIFNVQQAVGATPRGYDFGGVLPHGGIGVNMSGKPEMVLNSAQAAALESRINNIGTNATTHVYIDGVEVAHRAVVEDNNRSLIRDLNRGYRT